MSCSFQKERRMVFLLYLSMYLGLVTVGSVTSYNCNGMSE
jgi:hypothetical protein